jgi:hypothetical protein
MSDQHAAATVTAAAIITMILFARKAILHQDGRRHPARTCRPPRRHPTSHVGRLVRSGTAPGHTPSGDAIVREAERHVHRCWQQLGAHSDPPE